VNIKWDQGAPAPVDRAGHSAVEYNGAIYVGGGWYGEDQYHYQIDIYHPGTNKWDSLNTPHALFAMTVLTNKLVIAGGLTSNGHNTNNVVVLDNGDFKEYTKMPTVRCRATAVSHQSMMIVMGGYDGSSRITTIELFDALNNQWFKCDDLPQSLSHLQATIVDNMLYVTSGADVANSPSKAVYCAPLNTLSNHQLSWEQLCDSPLPCMASVSLGNKYLLIVGGRSRSNTVYVLKDRLWKVIGTLLSVQYYSSAVNLGNKIFVIAGKNYDTSIGNAVSIGTFL